MTDATTTLSPLAAVREKIARACEVAKRDPATVTLIAVSKTFEPDAIVPVIGEGQRVFGENRVQESQAKWPALREKYSGIDLHLIGPLQSNKTKEAVALFDAIHSVDRPSICAALAKEIAKQIRLRNLSGIIIIDFIDMELKKDQELLMSELEDYFKKDPVKTTLVDMTALGLVEVTRKKVRKPLHEQVEEIRKL